MWPLPADVLPMLSRSGPRTGRLLASVNGSGFSYPVRLSDGSVTISASSPIRRRLSCTVAARIDAPEVDVFRTELRADYGIVRPDGTTHWTPVGTFVVTDAEEVADGIVRVTGEDRWRRVVNGRLLTPAPTSGSTVAAIAELLQGAGLEVVDETGSLGTHPASLWERDRDRAVLDLAKSIGAVVVLDPLGVARIRTVGALSDQVVWRMYGGSGGVLVQARRGASQARTFNAVVVTGEPPDAAPVRSVRLLQDSSPVRFGGPFASRPRFIRTPLATTQEQVDAMAEAVLARVSGVAKTVTAESAPHPGLDGDDVVEVEVEPGVYQRHIVDEFPLPLGIGMTSLSTRSAVEDEGE